MVRAGQIKPDELVVVNCTGHTMSIEKEILGEGWVRNLSTAAVGIGSKEPRSSKALLEDSGGRLAGSIEQSYHGALLSHHYRR